MSVDDKIREIENRLTAIEKERSALLTELKSMRAQLENQTTVALLGRPTLFVTGQSL